MTHFTWLAAEAKTIHQYFESIFYVSLGFFLVLGVTLEYFKMPLQGVPTGAPLVGRCLIAAILLVTVNDVIHLASTLSEALSQKLGDPNQFHVVRAKMGHKLSELSWSWVHIKESITVALCFISFSVFYLSIYIADAFFLYTWTLLYIFSPVLISLFVLPSTSCATKALYRSLFEISLWKPVWMVTATILWSSALSDLNKPASQTSFLSVICYCLIFTGSLIVTPFLVHALAGGGVSSLVRGFGAVSVGASVIGPGAVVRSTKNMGSHISQVRRWKR